MSHPWADDVVRGWRESAEHWERHAATVREMFDPMTAPLLDAARVGEGDDVLDVACGPGEPAMTVATRVGSSGLVVCSDIAFGMVRAAARAAEARELGNVRAVACSAESLPFATERFDRVVCRLGVMFFPDADRTVREMLRVLEPGGRLALVAWFDKGSNPFFRFVTEIVATYVESEPEPPDAPGAWRFAGPGELAHVVASAGADEVVEQVLDFDIAAPIDFDAFWNLRVQISDTLREKTARLSTEELARLQEEIREATRSYFPDGKMRFPARVVIVAGRRRDRLDTLS